MLLLLLLLQERFPIRLFRRFGCPDYELLERTLPILALLSQRDLQSVCELLE